MTALFRSSCVSCLVLGLSLWMAAGCGSGESTPQESAQPEKSDSASHSNQLPTVSIGNSSPDEPSPPASDDASEALEAQWKKGSPEWLVQEIKNLRALPLPTTDDPEELAVARRKMNLETVDLATEILQKTHNDEQKEDLFNEAVHLLMVARMQLAMQGDRDDVDALYEDAEALIGRDPQSLAAKEAALVRTRFVHTIALRYGREEPKWLEEFARQARLFATNFPAEETHAVQFLDAAALSCELNGLTQQAVECYGDLEHLFPDTQQALIAAGALRRLSLEGQPLELAGPTVDGRFISAADLKGKVVLVAFWAAGSPRFRSDFPKLNELTTEFGAEQFSVLSINMDADETSLANFLQDHPLNWTHLFFSDPEERRWKNPIVQYYGVRDIPTYWLVDTKGVVADLNPHLEDCRGQIRELIRAN